MNQRRLKAARERLGLNRNVAVLALSVFGLLIAPAGAIGGILWTYDPRAPLQVAGAVGMLGVAAFWATSRERSVR